MDPGGASAQFHLLVEAELNQERASALGRSGRRMADALDDCAEALAGLRAAFARVPPSGRARTVAVEEYRAAHENYRLRRLEFVIQREANKQYDHTLVDRMYPAPPTPREALGSVGGGEPGRFPSAPSPDR